MGPRRARAPTCQPLTAETCHDYRGNGTPPGLSPGAVEAQPIPGVAVTPGVGPPGLPGLRAFHHPPGRVQPDGLHRLLRPLAVEQPEPPAGEHGRAGRLLALR